MIRGHLRDSYVECVSFGDLMKDRKHITIRDQGTTQMQTVEVTMVIVATGRQREVKVGRGQKSRVRQRYRMAGRFRVRQSSVIQRWSKGTGRQADSGSGREVRQIGSESGQARVKTRRARK